jgi:hypothetical protein
MVVGLIKATQNSRFPNNSQNGNDVDVTPKYFHGFSLYSKSAVNHALGTEIGSEIPEESERPKRKRVSRQLADTLNGCLCGSVLNDSVSDANKFGGGCRTEFACLVTLHVTTIYIRSH